MEKYTQSAWLSATPKFCGAIEEIYEDPTASCERPVKVTWTPSRKELPWRRHLHCLHRQHELKQLRRVLFTSCFE